MINIKRKDLLILCILSISMILVSCNKEENHAENNRGEFSVSDTNKEASMPETKEVETKEIFLIDTIQPNQKMSFERTITVNSDYGRNLNIYVINQGSNPIVFNVYQGNTKVDKAPPTLAPGKYYQFSTSITKKVIYKITCMGYNGATWSADIRATQY